MPENVCVPFKVDTDLWPGVYIEICKPLTANHASAGQHFDTDAVRLALVIASMLEHLPYIL